jgi:hypothetical protein
MVPLRVFVVDYMHHMKLSLHMQQMKYLFSHKRPFLRSTARGVAPECSGMGF